MSMYILVAYDVDTTEASGQRRLRQVAKACQDFGQRVQNSVFECTLPEGQFCLLKARLAKIIDKSRDSIRFYYLNKNRPPLTLGQETAYDVDDTLIV